MDIKVHSRKSTINNCASWLLVRGHWELCCNMPCYWTKKNISDSFQIESWKTGCLQRSTCPLWTNLPLGPNPTPERGAVFVSTVHVELIQTSLKVSSRDEKNPQCPRNMNRRAKWGNIQFCLVHYTEKWVKAVTHNAWNCLESKERPLFFRPEMFLCHSSLYRCALADTCD